MNVHSIVTNQPHRNQTVRQVDVLVVGGGPGGLAAAVSSARNNANVLLIEEMAFPGGNLAQPGLQLLGSHMSDGRAVIGGFAEELYERLIANNAATPRILCPKLGSLVSYDHQLLRCIVLDMLQEARVRMLLETRAVDVVCRDGRVEGIVIENASGRSVLQGSVVIDATGGADIVARAGGTCFKGNADGALQPASMLFRLGKVRVPELVAYLETHPDEIAPIGNPPTGTFPPGYFRNRTWALTGLMELASRAKAKGDFPQDLSYLNIFPMVQPDQIGVNAVKVFGVDANSADDITRGNIEGHSKVMQTLRFFRKYVPGCSDSVILDVGVRLGIRESRRIQGLYVLTGEDVLAGRRFGDAVAEGGYPIDVHLPGGVRSRFILLKNPYDIPYRCLLPKELNNVLVAGRAISTDEDSFGAIRGMTSCMAIGQAAGTAAALAVAAKKPPRDLDVGRLQATLTSQGAILNQSRGD